MRVWSLDEEKETDKGTMTRELADGKAKDPTKGVYYREIGELLFLAIRNNRGAKKRALLVVKWMIVDGLSYEEIRSLPEFLDLYPGDPEDTKKVMAVLRQDFNRGKGILRTQVRSGK